MRAPLAALALVLALVAIPGPSLAYSPAAVEPDPFLAGNVTVGAHLAGYGTFDYPDNQGVRAAIPGLAVDDRIAEPFNVSWAKVSAPGVLQDNAIGIDKWTDPAKWSVQQIGGTPTCTMSEDTVDGAGKALHVKAVGVGECRWTFVVSPAITTDLTKVLFLLGVDVIAVPAAGYHIYEAKDNEFSSRLSDYTVDPLQATDGCHDTQTWVIATVAGVSVLEQQPLKRPCAGAWQDLTNVGEVRFMLSGAGGTAEARVFALGFPAGAYSLGTDGAGAAVTSQVQADTEGVGLAVLAPTFAFERIGDLRAAFVQRASSLPSERVSVILDGDAKTGSYRFEFGVPSAVDLAYGTIVADDPLRVDGVQVQEATWGGTSILSSYATRVAGEVVRVAGNVAAGGTIPLQLTIGYTEDEWPLVGTGGGGGVIFPSLRDAVTIGIAVAIVLVVVWLLLRRRSQKRQGNREAAPLFVGPASTAVLNLDPGLMQQLVAVGFILLIFAGIAYLLLRGRFLSGAAAPIRRESERQEARSAGYAERAAEARVRRIESEARVREVQAEARERVRERRAGERERGRARRAGARERAKARRPKRSSRMHAVLVAAGLAAVLLMGLSQVAAIARPILEPAPGTVYLSACTRDPITCGFEAVVTAITDGMSAIVKAFAGIFVAVFNALGVAFATAFTILIVAPFHFLQAAFNEAERGLAGLGLLGPWAWGIIALGFFIFAYFAVLIIRAMIGALMPGELEEAE